MKSKRIWLTTTLLLAIILVGCNKECMESGTCDLVPESGNCFAAIPKYYFDQEEQKCKEFTWGGCGGVVPFETLEECEDCGCAE